MKAYFKTENLAVGYDGKILIHDINLRLEKGKILTLIGPNGAGKSTILKSITRHLQTISGRVYVGGQELHRWQPKELAKRLAVVLTDRIRPELTTCAEVVAMGVVNLVSAPIAVLPRIHHRFEHGKVRHEVEISLVNVTACVF